MCSLGMGILQEGIQEGFFNATVDHVNNLISYGLDLDEIFKILKINDETKEKILEALKEN